MVKASLMGGDLVSDARASYLRPSQLSDPILNFLKVHGIIKLEIIRITPIVKLVKPNVQYNLIETVTPEIEVSIKKYGAKPTKINTTPSLIKSPGFNFCIREINVLFLLMNP